jgi:hypothetical protein
VAPAPVVPEEVDAAFLALRYTRGLAKLGPRLLDPAFWRELNPELTVSDQPPATGATAYVNDWASTDFCQERLRTEGYFLTPPIVPASMVVRLRAAVERIVAYGLPPGCALLYDEFYRVYASVLAQSLTYAVAPVAGG